MKTQNKELDLTSKKAQCLTCGYEWNTKSDKLFVSCPSCLTKVQLRKIKKEKTQ